MLVNASSLEEMFSFDGGGEVVSRMRRGVLSLRVVLQIYVDLTAQVPHLR